jgi:serine phosphatase RsbU (regulator of sigma subunit)
VTDNINYYEKGRRLNPQDTLVLVTDGITEARPNVTDMFGLDGIKRYLEENGPETGMSVDELASGVLEAAKAFAGGSLQDDAAVVAIRWTDSTKMPD